MPGDHVIRLDQMIKLSSEVATAYARANEREGRREWDALAYVSGFMGDVGDLAKLVSASVGLRDVAEFRPKLAHELSDCLWSILVLSELFEVDLATAYETTMQEILVKLNGAR